MLPTYYVRGMLFLIFSSSWYLSCSEISLFIILSSQEGLPCGSDDKESACNAEDLSSIPGSGRCLEKGMEIYYRILARRIAWTEEPSGLQPIVSQRAGRY